MRRSRHTRAFSLLELVCVVGIVAVAAGVLGGATWHVQSSMQLRVAAEEFVQSVKTARRYALDHQCRTRLAFRGSIFDGAPEEEETSYRLLAFVVPSAAPGDAGRWVAVSSATATSLPEARTEWARVELSPRSESLVGRWMACDLDPKPRKLPDAVTMTSAVFERFQANKHALFFAENFFTPESFWTSNVVHPHEPKNCLSIYPENYHLTPIDQGPVLIHAPLPESERCTDPMTGNSVAASLFWPGSVHFIRGVDASKLRELPALEFQPDGGLACTWTREIEVRFAFADRPQPSYRVAIDVVTGQTRIVEDLP